MVKIKIIIERAKDGGYGAYGEKVKGIYGMGDTVQQAKDSAMEGLKLFVESNDARHIPKELKGDYEIVYKYDTQSFLDYYKGIFTNAALERITGINQKQIQHYASGLKKPRPAQVKKIEAALHNLGAELMSVEL
jgi:predicted RNase H-like HicB family nuclease